MTKLFNLTAPKTIANHAGVDRVVAGDDQGSDRKYWVFLKEGWGYYESGQRDEYCWISGGFGVDSVAEFRQSGLEYRREKDLTLPALKREDDSSPSDLTTEPRYLGVSRDSRTNRWKIICPVCSHAFEPETTMRSTQHVICPGRKCGRELVADYNAEPPVVRALATRE